MKVIKSKSSELRDVYLKKGKLARKVSLPRYCYTHITIQFYRNYNKILFYLLMFEKNLFMMKMMMNLIDIMQNNLEEEKIIMLNIKIL